MDSQPLCCLVLFVAEVRRGADQVWKLLVYYVGTFILFIYTCVCDLHSGTSIRQKIQWSSFNSRSTGEQLRSGGVC